MHHLCRLAPGVLNRRDRIRQGRGHQSIDQVTHSRQGSGLGAGRAQVKVGVCGVTPSDLCRPEARSRCPECSCTRRHPRRRAAEGPDAADHMSDCITSSRQAVTCARAMPRSLRELCEDGKCAQAPHDSACNWPGCMTRGRATVLQGQERAALHWHRAR